MPGQILNENDVNQILTSADLIKRARIFEGSTKHPASVQVITIALDNAMVAGQSANAGGIPSRVGFPFKTCYVASATDISVSVNLRPYTMDSQQGDIPIKQGDAVIFGDPISEAFLSWPAQAGKSITLVFCTDAEFKNGSQVSVSNGSVTVGYGSTVTTQAKVTLAATTATIIAPALTTRKQATLQNNSGADLYIGGSTVTNLNGIKVADGGIITWQNTAALYGYSIPGGDVMRMEEA